VLYQYIGGDEVEILYSPLKEQSLGKGIQLDVQAVELLDATLLVGSKILDSSRRDGGIVLLEGNGEAQVEGLLKYVLRHLQGKGINMVTEEYIH